MELGTVQLLFVVSVISGVLSVPLRHPRVGGVRKRVGHVKVAQNGRSRRFDDNLEDIPNGVMANRASDGDTEGREPMGIHHQPHRDPSFMQGSQAGIGVAPMPMREAAGSPDTMSSQFQDDRNQVGVRNRLVNNRNDDDAGVVPSRFERTGRPGGQRAGGKLQRPKVLGQRRSEFVTESEMSMEGMGQPAVNRRHEPMNVIPTEGPPHFPARVRSQLSSPMETGDRHARMFRKSQQNEIVEHGHHTGQEDRWPNHQQGSFVNRPHHAGAARGVESDHYAAGNGEDQESIGGDNVVRHQGGVVSDDGEEQLRTLLKDITKLRQEIEQDSEVKLSPPDHLVGLPLERDGGSNGAMHREAFFGKELNTVHGMSSSNTMRRLRMLFQRADSNSDQQLDSTELGEWIHQRSLEHMDSAQTKNRADFAHVDRDGDNELQWNEYTRHIQHMKPSDVQRHAPKHLSKAIWRDLQRLKNGKRVSVGDESMRINMENSTLHRLLLRDLQRWRNADTDNDMKLSEGEFFTFRHPEYHGAALKQFVSELISELDQNGDGRLTLDEYLMGSHNHQSSDPLAGDGSEERRHQFTELIDVDGDGIATPDELEQFVDPLSAQSSINSALSLIRRIDTDKNSKVSWDELLAHQNLFLSGHMNPIVRRTHNEL